MNKTIVIIAGWVLVQILLAGMAIQSFAGTDPVKIVVREFSQVEGDPVLLGQIAEIQAKPFIREILEILDLGRSPRPGKIKTLSKNRLASQLRSLPGCPEDIQLESPDKIYVKQAYQELSKQNVRDKVGRLLSTHFEGQEYEIKRIQIQSTELYPRGDLEMVTDSSMAVDEKGTLDLVLDILVNRKKVDAVRVRGQVAVYENIACASRDLERGSALSPEDCSLVKMDIFSIRGPLVRDIDALAGQQLKIHVRKNEPIRTDWLIPMPLIRKGDVVALVARADHMRIVTSGIAREDGFKDKMVRVENLKSGKVVRGIAKDEATVDVIF